MNLDKINFLIYSGEEHTIISYETEEIVEKVKNINSLLEDWCLQDGCSLSGRIAAMKYWLNIKKKVPVLVNKENQIIFFPTESKKNIGCIWIAYHKVKKICKMNSFSSKIVFKNGQELAVKWSVRIIRKQMERCKKYLKFLEEMTSFYANMEVEDEVR